MDVISKRESAEQLIKPGNIILRILDDSRVYTAPIIINVIYRIYSKTLG